MATALIFRERLLAPSETFIVEQAKLLRRYRPILVGLRRTRPRLDHAIPEIMLRNGDAAVDRVAASVFRKLPVHPRFFERLGATNSSIVHAHFAIDAVQALPIVQKLDLPLVVSLHGYDVTSSDAALQKSFAGRHFLKKKSELLQRASAFLCVSNFIREIAIQSGFPAEKLLVHYTGIDCRQFKPTLIERDPKLVLFVGRLVEKKGCEYVIRAMAAVQKRNPHARLEVIGDGPLRASLEALATIHSVRAEFRGAQAPEEVRRSMARARILCNPSVTASSGDKEGFGMVFAEAQAVGTPVVSFTHAAIPEVVNHGKTGLLCAEKDIAGLASAIELLIEDTELWNELSQNAVEWVNGKFNLANQSPLLESLYDRYAALHRRDCYVAQLANHTTITQSVVPCSSPAYDSTKAG